ncbi:hypothetical protein [Reyranella sp. CPCC 100927]|uniref:hypothetical protein n=1 Tax=Reyranella sp. CPCC 100927 TaxID=2599616 RepID=UPI0011B80F18|nr:hypothetical protein [Reyranella sp. CPCC 100927]TWT00691.1 hypothetical protein FQU96_33080 [Reyranella sp. CPCC 100927]
MPALNESDFADPTSRRMALGLERNPSKFLWLDPKGNQTLALQNGGMINPVRFDLHPGETIYRFGTQADGPQRVMGGGWWVQRRELDHLIRFSEVHGVALSRAVRVLCCVPPEWGSALDLLIAARPQGVLATYRGLANSAVGMQEGTRGAVDRTRTDIAARNDISAWRLNQLYIPGLYKPGAAQQWLSFEGKWPVTGPGWIYTR